MARLSSRRVVPAQPVSAKDRVVHFDVLGRMHERRPPRPIQRIWVNDVDRSQRLCVEQRRSEGDVEPGLSQRGDEANGSSLWAGDRPTDSRLRHLAGPGHNRGQIRDPTTDLGPRGT